jgi:hypothetical protein
MARGAAARGRTRTTRATRRAFDRDARARAIEGVKLVDGARARARRMEAMGGGETVAKARRWRWRLQAYP